MASAATLKRNKDWQKPFLGAILVACILFFASGLLIKFGDVKLLIKEDLSYSFLLFAFVELVFRGVLTRTFGRVISTALFIILFSFAFFSLIDVEPIYSVLFVGLYGAGMSLLREEDEVWSCVLGAWGYFMLVLISIRLEFFATAVLSLFLLSAPLYWETRKRDFSGALLTLGLRGNDIFRNLLIGVGATVFVFVFIAVFSITLYYIGLNDLDMVESKISGAPSYVYLMAVSFSPISEEVFFRGLLFPIMGAIPSSIIFAVSHAGYGSWVEIGAAFFIGYFYCWLYKKTGSLIPCIVSHCLFNGISLLLIKTVA